MRASLLRWVYKPLGELTEKIGSGATPKGGQGAYKESGISLIRSLNVHDLEFRYKDLARIDDEQAAALSNVEVDACDVLLNITGASIARCVQVPLDVLPARVNQHVSILRPKKGLLDSRFLSYLLVSDATKNQLLNIGDKAGATRQALTKAQLQAFAIPVPPLDEQKRIVAILDQAFAALDRARALAEANLADAQELQENTLESMFRDLARPDWMMSLANAVHPECKLSYGIVQPGDDVDGGLPIVRPVDLKTRVITLNTLKRIAPERAEGYARTQLVGGELLLCVRGSTGEVSVASESLAGCNVTRGIVPIRFDTTRVLPEFAFFQFRSRFVRDQIAAKTYGAALMQINIKDLRELDFVVPPVSEQRKAIARAEQFFDGGARLSENYQTQLTDLANLRQSLLQKAFSGQLT